MKPILLIRDAVGWLTTQAIHFWLCLCGQRVTPPAGGWLDSAIGPDGVIGDGILDFLEREHGLVPRPAAEAGLHACFDHLRGAGFEPGAICPQVRDFYEHTARYRLQAAGRSNPFCWCFLYLLVRFVSRRMNQLNFPIAANRAGRRHEQRDRAPPRAQHEQARHYPVAAQADGHRPGHLCRAVRHGEAGWRFVLVVHGSVVQRSTATLPGWLRSAPRRMLLEQFARKNRGSKKR